MIVSTKDYIISLYQSKGEGKLEEIKHPSEIPTLSRLSSRDWQYMRVLNLADISHSMRFNPIQLKYIPTLQDALAFADRLLKRFAYINMMDKQSTYFMSYNEASKNLLGTAIWFIINYKRMPYRTDGTELFPEYYTDKYTGHAKLSGRVYADKEHTIPEEPAYWLGKYSDMPHVLSFLNKDYNSIFQVLETDPECFSLISMLISSWRWKSFDLLELFMMPLRTTVSRLYTKEIFWLLHKDGDDFDISSQYNRDYLLIACKEEHQYLFELMTLFIAGKIPGGKIWNYENDKEFRWEYYKTIREALDIMPYMFESEDVKKEVLYNLFNRAYMDVDEMIMEIEHQFVKEDICKR